MKLDDIKPTIETSGEMAKEEFFSIQDTGMIFDILRNKMYSNSIEAIVREISCNARDAHREAGKADVPIEIILPNVLDPSFRIRDFGTGISPDRMYNIFVKYTASTKRNDNLQTGGFGLGAKTPFSYSDSFNIITRYNGKAYHYCAYIDETKVGKMVLLSEEYTDQSNGTEIIVPVHNKLDYSRFREAVSKSCCYWKVKPIVKGVGEDENLFVEMKPAIYSKNNKWQLIPREYYSPIAIAIVDGIQYNIDNHTDLHRFFEILRNYNGSLLLEFEVGELSLSANREQLSYDKKTVAALLKAIDIFQQECHKEAEELLDKQTSYLDACLFFQNSILHTFTRGGYSAHNTLQQFKWKGKKLSECIMSNGVGIYKKNDSNAWRKFSFYHLNLEKDTVYLKNDSNLDLGQLKISQIKNLIDAFPEKKRFCFINVNKSESEIIDNLTDLKLSDYYEHIGSSKKDRIKLTIYYFDTCNKKWRRSSLEKMEKSTQKVVFVPLISEENNSYGTKVAVKNDETLIANNLMSWIASSFEQNYNFFGYSAEVPKDRIKKDFDEYLLFDDFLVKLKSDLEKRKEEIIKEQAICSMTHHSDFEFLWWSNSIFADISKDSVLGKLIKATQKCADVVSNKIDERVFNLFETEISYTTKDLADWLSQNIDYNIDYYYQEAMKKYPMIAFIPDWRINSEKETLVKIKEYVNLIEKEQTV